MGKVDSLLPWLNITQALSRLSELIREPVTEDALLQLCEHGQCAVYFDSEGRKGEVELLEDEDCEVHRGPVIGRGFCKLERPLQIAEPTRRGFHVSGSIWAMNSARRFEDCCWFIHTADSYPTPIFKQTDIQHLAQQLNGTVIEMINGVGAHEALSSALQEVEDLRRQLEQERVAKEAAEKRAESALAEAKPSHLLTIAVLLELLERPIPYPRSHRIKQDAIKNSIQNEFSWRGLSKRNLDDIFSSANKARKEAE